MPHVVASGAVGHVRVLGLVGFTAAAITLDHLGRTFLKIFHGSNGYAVTSTLRRLLGSNIGEILPQ